MASRLDYSNQGAPYSAKPYRLRKTYPTPGLSRGPEWRETGRGAVAKRSVIPDWLAWPQLIPQASQPPQGEAPAAPFGDGGDGQSQFPGGIALPPEIAILIPLAPK